MMNNTKDIINTEQKTLKEYKALHEYSMKNAQQYLKDLPDDERKKMTVKLSDIRKAVASSDIKTLQSMFDDMMRKL